MDHFSSVLTGRSRFVFAVLLFPLFAGVVAPPLLGQNQVFPSWIRDFSGPDGGLSTKLASDAEGNVYVTGGAAFRPSSDREFETAVVKYDPNGTVLWKAWLSSPASYSFGEDIAVDKMGNVYVLSSFYLERNNGILSGGEVVIAKYDPQGSRKWINFYRTPGFDLRGPSMAVSAAGNVYIPAQQGPPGLADGVTNVILLRYDTQGVPGWVRRVTSSAESSVRNDSRAIGIDDFENVFVAIRRLDTSSSATSAEVCEFSAQNVPLRCFANGEFGDILGFKVDASGNTFLSGSGASQGGAVGNNVLAKHNSDGSLAWFRDYGPPSGSLGQIKSFSKLDLDPCGNVLVLETQGSVNSGSLIGLLKLNAAGEQQWQSTWHSPAETSTGTTHSDIPQALIINSFGDTYIGGVSDDPAFFPNVSPNAVVLKFAAAGNLFWEYRDTESTHTFATVNNLAITGGALFVGAARSFPTIPETEERWFTTKLVQDAASLSPSSLTFPLTPLGIPGGSEPVELKNTSAQPLEILGIETSGDFRQVNDCPRSLAAGASCTIQVTFTPSSIGLRKGTLVVRDIWLGNQESPATVQIMGVGVGD